MGSFLSTKTTTGNSVVKEAEEAVVKGQVQYLRTLQEEKLLNYNFGTEISLKTKLLPQAASNGIYNCLEYLLEIGAEPNAVVDRSKNTSLHACVQCPRQNVIKCCKLLLKAKADINATNVWQRTPLLSAIIHYNFKLARYLVSEQACVNRCDENGTTPLIVCVSYGQVDLMDILIRSGANINQSDSKGRTPLYFAIVGRHIDIFHDLLSRGADMNTLNVSGETILHLSLSKCNMEAVKCLIELGSTMTQPKATYFDICVKIVQNAVSQYLSSSSTTPEPQVSSTLPSHQALDSLTCTRLIVIAHGESINMKVKPNKLSVMLKKLEDALERNLQTNSSKENKVILRSIKSLQRCIEMASNKKSRNVDSLQNICNRRCRQNLMLSKKNVIWAVNQLNIPQILKDMLFLNTCTFT